MRRLLILALCTAAAVTCNGATWHVAQDGSGDFTVIQDAIDAAAPGDVIRVHAGRYDEMTEAWDVWGDGSSYSDCHVVITKDNLTLLGDGPESTMIGPEQTPADPDPNYTGISVTYNEATSLTVRDLAIENVRYGMYVASPECEVSGARFEGMEVEGMRVFTASGCLVDNCEFLDGGSGVVSFFPTANLTVSNSRFEVSGLGVRCVTSENVVIANCVSTGGLGGFDFQQGTHGTITDVSVSDYNFVGISLTMGGFAEVYDSMFEGGYTGIYSNGEGVICERSSFIGQTHHTFFISNSGISSIRNCEIINGGGWSVFCDYNGTADCHIDMTNNYWGTDSEEQIAEWIYDSTNGSDYCCIVDFVPFQGSVATQNRSWSEVKGIFRDAGVEQ